MGQEQKENNLNEFNKFLDNNTDFLQEKYAEYFNNRTFKLKDANREAIIKYIYDVFSFSKYENDEKLNKTLRKSLNQNIDEHFESLKKKKKMFDQTTAVQLLKYCIENNEMFSVKYDKKEKKMKTEERTDSQVFENTAKQGEDSEQPEGGEKEETGKEEPEQVESQSEKEKENEVINETENQHTQKEETERNSEEDHNLVNEFVTQEEPKALDPELIKKNLKTMFQFYCKQQQNTGARPTFDRISYECSTMNLGKMLAFARITGVFSDKLNKNLITRKFKLIAEGRREIEFPKFYELINVFAQIDEAIIFKLGVNEKESFKEKMKTIVKPFSTQDLTPRELVKEHVFIPILTSHSGKPSDALADEIKLRKQAKSMKMSESQQRASQLKSLQKSRYDTYKLNEIRDSSQIMNPKELYNSNVKDFEHELKFLERIIGNDNDEEFLKDYQLPKVHHLPPRVMPRKDNIVRNLKKRVQELERTETRQSVHMDRRRNSALLKKSVLH